MNLPSVNRRQMALYVFFVPFVFKVVMLPGYLARGAGRDAWLSVALLLAIELAELALILLIHRAGGLSAFREKAGTVLSNIVLVPLLFAFGAKTIVYLSEAINYITAYLFYNITNLSVAVIFLVVIGYVALRGMTAVVRVTELLAWLLPMILVLGLLFGKVHIEPMRLLPVLGDGTRDVFDTSGGHLMWTANLTPLLFCRVEKPEGAKKYYVPIAAVLAFGGVTAVYLFFVMNYGASAELIENAFARLAAFNVVNTQIGSIDWPAVALWVGMATVTLASKIFASGMIFENAGIRREAGIIVFLTVVGIVGYLWFNNVEKAYVLGTSVVSYIVIGVTFLSLLVILITLKLKITVAEKGGRTIETVG